MQMMTEFVSKRMVADSNYKSKENSKLAGEKSDFKEALSSKLKEKLPTEAEAVVVMSGIQLLKEFEVNGKMMKVTVGEVVYDSIAQPLAEDAQPKSEEGAGVGIAELLLSGEEQNTADNLLLAAVEKTGLSGLQTAKLDGEKNEGKTEVIMPVESGETLTAEVSKAAKVEMPLAMNQPAEAVPIEELNDLIATKLEAGKTEFEVELLPEQLGKITIKATMQAGEAIISIICKESDTLNLLSRNAADLVAIVENKLGSETQVVVESRAADYLEQQNNQNQNNQSENKSSEKQQNEKSEFEQQNDFLQQLRLGLQTF